MRYLHTMVRVADLDASLDFYCTKLGLKEVERKESETGRYTNVFLAAPGDDIEADGRPAPLVELTYNWDPEDYGSARNFGHLAYDGRRRGHQSPAARRENGLRPLARRHLHRTFAKASRPAAGRALGVHGQYRLLVRARPCVLQLTRPPGPVRLDRVMGADFDNAN